MLTQRELDHSVLRSVEGPLGKVVEMYVPTRNQIFLVEGVGEDQVKVMDGEEVVAVLEMRGGRFVVVTDES